MNDPEALFESLDELTPMKYILQLERAATTERQERCGSGGGRTKGLGSGELLERDASPSSGRGASGGAGGSGSGGKSNERDRSGGGES